MQEPVSDAAVLCGNPLPSRGQVLAEGLQLFEPVGLGHLHYLAAQHPCDPCTQAYYVITR